MNDYTVVIKVEICECKDKQEAIDFVADNIGLSEFNLEIYVEENENEPKWKSNRANERRF